MAIVSIPSIGSLVICQPVGKANLKSSVSISLLLRFVVGTIFWLARHSLLGGGLLGLPCLIHFPFSQIQLSSPLKKRIPRNIPIRIIKKRIKYINFVFFILF
jgi:hypothetical protein